MLFSASLFSYKYTRRFIVAKLNNQPPSSYSGLTRVSLIALEKQDTRVKPEYDDTVIVSYLALSFFTVI